MALLESVFNHLVLPPKLPGQLDKDVEGIEHSILTRLIRACDTLGKLAGQEFAETWTSIRHSLRVCPNVNQGRLDKTLMLQEFCGLRLKDLLILHVVKQNAALLVRRHVSNGVDTVIFEAFEASPSSEAVLAAENALQWDFPGRAAEIPFDEFVKEPFQDSLATFLEQASMESLERLEAHSSKAKASVIEVRDTTDPALVTQMLMPLLEAVGCSVDVPRLRKRVRDDVNIQNGELPWRRLPFWLVLRVATQRQLCLALGSETGRACYKFLTCTVLAQLLDDCAGELAPELTVMLKAKLCRRLAKLEMDKTQVCSASAAYKQLFGSIGPLFKGIIEKATEQVESAWTNFKKTITRPIPKLPSRADEHALCLSLPNSWEYLSSLLTLPHAKPTYPASLHFPPSSDGAIEQVQKFTDRYFNLARLESRIEAERPSAPESVAGCEVRCLEIGESIADLFTAVGSAYDSNPEQISIFILNLFDLWVQMDKCAVKACPLLRDYHPVFTPELLDVLHLPTLSGMQRLQDIQSHLRDRRRNCRFTHKTIFSEPDKDCFAARYLKQSDRGRILRQQIENASDRSRENKKAEWEDACEKYNDLSRKIADGTCVCSVDINGSRNVRGCTKCWYWRCRKRMDINIHEDFLPKDSVQSAAVVFELDIPSYLAVYRNAAWRIFSDLGHPSKPSASSSPAMLLKDDSRLQTYMKSTANGVSLASATKSFLQTHFKAFKIKVSLSDILLPLGQTFSYYDMRSGTWLKDLDKPLTFQHLCGIHVPRGLQGSVIRPSVHPGPNTDGPSSYEIIASQTKCPSDMSVHEFTSYQRLLSGKTRRWLTMLVELGASNANFSTEDTMHVFSQLAVQAGPAKNDETDLLRDVHLVFRDQSFCQRLTEQIDKHLRNILSNWRETHCMEMLITLSLRLFTLTSGPDHQSAERLLTAARGATLQWISNLRDEVRNATEADVAERAARYGFWAALLCRRTFATFVGSDAKMNAEDLCSFVQASVALQENLVVDPANLPQNLKNLLVRDLKMAYQIQFLIRESIQSNPNSLGAAINKTWSDPANSTGRTYSPWQLLPSPNNRWAVSTITSTASKFTVPQVVHYNLVEGHLLVDGKPLGRLPRDIRASEDVKELFGNQHLLTFPSPLGGMSHVMATRIRGHEIHFGLRGNSVVIRALTMDGPLEYVPRRVFMDNDSFDLPSGLIDNCVHWLNIRSGRLEIRRKPAIWRTRQSDWILDVRSRQAQRKMVFLVDPHSDLCKRVAGIFRHFEEAKRLTVFQPVKGSLSVELRHLELSFFVNRSSLLECRELYAEIDPNQDAGTLYGFESKIVLRDVANNERRSIITALGKLTYKRHGMHVAVRACNTNEYGRFGIDSVLGRLTCPPEPRILYSKAQFHAFTSFVLPDPLTGRTGTEEALHMLRSGYCQPWTPMGDIPASILRVIKGLSPSRDYYPKGKRRLQTVNWNQHLTMNIQHDSYEAFAQEILTKSNRLQSFAQYHEEAMEFKTEIPSHLQTRGQIRRLVYERGSSDSDRLTTGKDTDYKPRDRQASLPQATNVYQIVRLVRKRPFSISMTRDLAAILCDWKLIGGFHNTLESLSSCLSDLIENKISGQWGSLVNLCRHTNAQDPYRLMFRLSLLSFSTNPDMDLIKSLAAFCCLDELKVLPLPSCPSFVEFKLHESPTLGSLLKFIAADYPIFEPDPGRSRAQQDLARENHQILCEAEGRSLARFLLEQWPNSKLSAEEFESTAIDVDLALERIRPEWQRLCQNMELSKYVAQAQGILDRHEGAMDMSAPQAWNAKPTIFWECSRGSVIPSLSGDLLVKYGPLPWDHSPTNHQLLPGKDSTRIVHSPNERNDVTPPKEVIELGKILGSFASSSNDLRQQYGNDLKKSLTALENVSRQPKLQETPPDVNFVRACIEKARATLIDQLERIRNALSAKDDRFHWLQLGSLWPCTTPVTILEQLRSSSDHQFGDNMREGLVSFGVLVTTLQRLLRIKHAQLKGDRHKLFEEWQNTGHENWSPLDFPDWLLLEIDSDVLIRREQVDVAHATISPASGSNSVLQMNMGKGKSSCIVPMATAILANKKQLSRLIAPKALLLQTAQTMQSKIGGLIGREIRHIPFSRRTSTTPNMLQLYSELHREILCCCGVILTTPEHILSYKLSGLQRLADSRLKEAGEMVGFQSWLTRTCRDVLDESDFTLAVKTQLIYPSGPQISVDGHPHRWEVAQMLLSLVVDYLPDLQREFPHSIEVVQRPHGFPMVYFLRTDVEDALHRRIINDISDGRTPFLRLADSTSPVSKGEIERVLSEEDIDFKLVKRVSRFFADRPSARKIVLLVRGLLWNKILLLCLKKRWNVQYGLHPNRYPIAVPFDAKGVPNEQSEFGQPDVAILFTCLAFYYSGLNLSQFRDGLQNVLKSDDPAAKYDRWTYDSDTLPEALHHWNVINVDDQGQVEELWRHLRFNRNVLDYYMNSFVFPVHAKQFGVKLQASGWDVPLFSKSRPGDKETSCAKTTGFSGTNDNKMMLPLTIKQDDLPSLRQTNAEVLTYLLQDRNRQYRLAAWQGKRLTEKGLLQYISNMGIRILIDAGAYILEMDNRSLVKAWLDTDTKAKGAVYFGTDNRAWVQYRGGKENVPLLATPFAENLDECLVYLGQAHTRGIDLKLPQNARGALTLALGQTKDHTVQAAMRLRQLGSTQSVVFFAPPEVHQSILDVCKKRQGDVIDSSHVVSWLLEQTCRANEQLQNLYIAQGMDFCRQTNAQWKNAKFLTDESHREAYLNVIQHPERHTLEQLYGGMTDTQASYHANLSSTELKGFIEELSRQRRAANSSGNAILSSALEEVEQEREVEFQVEEVRQMQKPTHYKALAFPGLHAAVSRFAKTGDLAGEHGYEHAFTALAGTGIGQKYNICRTASRLFVSAEFMRTVEFGKHSPNDNFLRPVEWILWNPCNETALIVVSEEVELLIPVIRANRQTKVHLITYAAPVTKNMLHFNGLLYYVLPRLPVSYTVPDWLSVELGIFAGRLYINFPECAPVAKYLQIADETGAEAPQNNSDKVGVFTKDPVSFLLDWLTLRRMGQDILHTPMGYVCQGRLLHKSHPFFVPRRADAVGVVPPVGGRRTGVGAEDGDTDLEDE
ncbi:hypothetical protein K432DRAFT_428888 [Lepidopterella palustris CBS 459.81]|uniref:ubiquitinyl hydrolase 1 n=1 Tax=Lepidopterella palustris CBS 459.81 TaxID=1314670 RepID=A0A8E2E2I0_9PEZI|nr:hypothetical protein K432DRAFT_428888 [Lepidopterella palustris CBS 459.81]